jgi:hypothetical protein
LLPPPDEVWAYFKGGFARWFDSRLGRGILVVCIV